MNGAYWGLTTLDLLGKLEIVDQDEVVSWVMECQHEFGGFGGNIRHDPQIVHTLNAVQVLTPFDKLNAFDIDKITNYIDGFTHHTCMTSLYSSHIHFLYSHTSCLLYPSSSMLTTHIFIFSNHLANPFLTLHPHHPCNP